MLLLLAAIYNAIIPKAIILNMWLNRFSGLVLQALEDFTTPGHVAQKSKVFCVVLLAPQSNKWTAEDGVHWLIVKSEPRFAVIQQYNNCNSNSNNNVFYYIKAVASKKKKKNPIVVISKGLGRRKQGQRMTWGYTKGTLWGCREKGKSCTVWVMAGPLASQGVKNHPHSRLYSLKTTEIQIPHVLVLNRSSEVMHCSSATQSEGSQSPIPTWIPLQRQIRFFSEVWHCPVPTSRQCGRMDTEMLRPAVTRRR